MIFWKQILKILHIKSVIQESTLGETPSKIFSTKQSFPRSVQYVVTALATQSSKPVRHFAGVVSPDGANAPTVNKSLLMEKFWAARGSGLDNVFQRVHVFPSHNEIPGAEVLLPKLFRVALYGGRKRAEKINW